MKKPKQPETSIQDIRMIDWYAAFILMKMSSLDADEKWIAREVFDRAEAMMNERNARIGVVRGSND